MTNPYDNRMSLTTIEETISKSVVKLVQYYLENLPTELVEEYKDCTYYYRWYNGDWSLEGEEIHKPFYKGGIIDRKTREWKMFVTAANNLECLVLLEAELISMINGRSLLKGVPV